MKEVLGASNQDHRPHQRGSKQDKPGLERLVFMGAGRSTKETQGQAHASPAMSYPTQSASATGIFCCFLFRKEHITKPGTQDLDSSKLSTEPG